VPQTEFSPATLAARLNALLNDPTSLAEAAAAARRFARDGAAEHLAALVQGLAPGRNGGPLGTGALERAA
jgi:UDP-N-acetylglucosamine--N-acetylmuramyl-(pentapeptide) pyrophosphoryl-undecaprenol N-acetylglucosamine transferase